MPKALNQIIANSHIAFGTSGARGLVTDFTDEVCAAFAQSFVKAMQNSFSFSRIALGIDNRPSSVQMAAACTGALSAIGIEVDYYGVLPTPALAYQAMQDKVPALMVTGSHIPFDRNGLKFYRPDGEISKADEQAILSVTEPFTCFTSHLPELSSRAADNYLKRYLDIYPTNLLVGKRIGIYEHSSAGRDLYHKLFSQLGADVVSLERTETFVPIDTEAVTVADQQKGHAWAAQYDFDMIFSTDGDGDRPLIADEQGQWLRGDIVGLLCAKGLGIENLAVPVSCNTAIEKSEFFNKVIRTKIGSPYVIAGFEELSGSFAGFEANGGFLLGADLLISGKLLKALPTRDALLPALALLALNKPLSQLVDGLPRRFTVSDRLQEISNESSKAFLVGLKQAPESLLKHLELASHSLIEVNEIDGLRMQLDNGYIIHIRPSGNAPELRFYIEACTENAANDILSLVMHATLNSM